MSPDDHAAGGVIGGKASPDRETRSQSLSQAHDVRCRAGPFIGEQLARPAKAALDLVIDEQDAFLVAKLAQAAQAMVWHRPGTALPLHRLDQDRRRGRTDCCFQRLMVTKGQMDKARQTRAKTVQIGRIATGIDRRIGPAVKGPFEGDDVDPLRLTLGRVIFAGQLQCRLDSFRPGIGKEHHIGKAFGRQTVGQLFLLRNAKDVGDVPQLLGLDLDRLDQTRMGVTQRIGGNASHAVQIGLAFGADQSRAFASFERQGRATVNAHQVGCRGRR